MAENGMMKKVLVRSCKCSRYTWAWVVRFAKIRMQKCRQCKAQREFNEKLKRLGTEIYSLYKQGDTDYARSLTVQQQLKLAESAEKDLFEIYDRLEQIDREYQASREDIAKMGHKEEE